VEELEPELGQDGCATDSASGACALPRPARWSGGACALPEPAGTRREPEGAVEPLPEDLPPPTYEEYGGGGSDDSGIEWEDEPQDMVEEARRKLKVICCEFGVLFHSHEIIFCIRV